jgi:uncharacterized FAD-dependent dehydrogenase
VDGKPHLGTDRLVRILRDMRAALQERGATFMFGTRVEDVLISDSKVRALLYCATTMVILVVLSRELCCSIQSICLL